MANSLRHIVKRRVHLERSQPKEREKKRGLLEKHKDYVLRAQDYHKKRKALQNLREKARTRNPDEFYFKMVKSRINAKGQYEKIVPGLTPEESLKLNFANRRLVELKRSVDHQASTKAQERLHGMHGVKLNSHVLFRDSDESDVDDEEKEDPRTNAHFKVDASSSESEDGEKPDTAINVTRLGIAAIASGKKHKRLTAETAMEAALNITESLAEEYENLAERRSRSKMLNSVLEKLELQHHLAVHEVDCIRQDENSAPIYKWKPKRKR